MTNIQPASSGTMWQDIYDLALQCGNAQDPKTFCIELIHALQTRLHFDGATLYFPIYT